MHLVAPPSMADAPARPRRDALRKKDKPAFVQMVRTERGTMPQRAAAPPPAPVSGATKAAARAGVGPPASAPARQPRIVPRLPDRAPGPHHGAPPGWPAQSRQTGPPRDWLARVERGAPQDWLDRVARRPSPLPKAAGAPLARRMARALALVLPPLRKGAVPRQAMPDRTAVTDLPVLARAPPAGAARPHPKAWPDAGTGNADSLAPQFPVAPGSDAPWSARAAGMAAPLRVVRPPHWQGPLSAPGHDPAAAPLAGPWPPLPPAAPEPDPDGAAAALREHERLRRIDLEQRGIGWNAWLS